jgi:hypothetical protein
MPGEDAVTASERQRTIAALEEALLPRLMELGYERIPLDAEDRRSREIRDAFPFGRLRQRRGEGFDQVEVQLHLNRPEAFRLNLGRIPKEGIPHPQGVVPAEDAWVHYLQRYWTMYRFPALRAWFSPSWPSWGKRPEERLAGAVAKAVEALPEVEALFVEGRQGPHLRLVSLE